MGWNPGKQIPLAFSNVGQIVATDVVITDHVPVNVASHITYHASLPITPTAGITYAWTLPDLAYGQGGVITITGVLSDLLPPGVFINTAVITTTAVDSNPDSNRSDAAITIAALPVVGGHTKPVRPLALMEPRVILTLMVSAGVVIVAVLRKRRKWRRTTDH